MTGAMICCVVRSPSSMDDWDAGRYEHHAEQLEPAAARAAQLAAVGPGMRVLDVGCGSGNFAALSAAAGADTTGLDRAPRLLDVARARVPWARFVVGDATDMPFTAGAFDAAVSVFGVIFAPAEAAAAELVRVVRPGGRIVVTEWEPAGTVFEAGGVLRRALAEHGAPDDDAPAFAWHEPATVRGLFAPHAVTISDEQLRFHADSPRAAADRFFDHQPMWLATRPVIGERAYEAARRETADLFAVRNEAADGWQATAGYRIAVVELATNTRTASASTSG